METVDASKLYQFLTELAEAARSRGDHEMLRRLSEARTYYRMPLTSEFLGVSMTTLKLLLGHARHWLSEDQAHRAESYADAIKQQFFS
jgi:hypothetical protein